MPLPSALLAKLKKRGIIKQDSPSIEEEIIAESYDDEEASGLAQHAAQIGAPGCPNTSNPYHRCTLYCWERYAGGFSLDKLEPNMDRKRKRMLKRYPLPPHWDEIFDPATARYYYWNTETDQVCWLSPSHPRAEVIWSDGSRKGRRSPRSSPPSSLKRKSDDKGHREQHEKHHRRNEIDDAAYQSRSRKSRRKEIDEEETPLDPMDPASYGDVPRGGWSIGLEQRGDAKTGVDTTANGPLFQQRPYPAPGAILKQNAEGKSRR